jgi:hypothetical protein
MPLEETPACGNTKGANPSASRFPSRTESLANAEGLAPFGI